MVACRRGGQLCYTTQAACESAPNFCGYTAGPGGTRCVSDYATCSTGMAAGAFGANNSWFCPPTMPKGSLPSVAGKPCYDTRANCEAG